MPGFLPIVLTASHFMLVADTVPKLNVEPSCRAAASAEISISANRNENSCLKDEATAHDLLAQQWTQYKPQQRANCVSLSSTGGYPSYVEVLTCLEMSKASAEMPAENKMDSVSRP